jgi:hypothetical protein
VKPGDRWQGQLVGLGPLLTRRVQRREELEVGWRSWAVDAHLDEQVPLSGSLPAVGEARPQMAVPLLRALRRSCLTHPRW